MVNNQVKEVESLVTGYGETLFRMALQHAFMNGTNQFNDKATAKEKKDCHARHEKAAAEGKHLFMTEAFENELQECALKISKLDFWSVIKYCKKLVIA